MRQVGEKVLRAILEKVLMAIVAYDPDWRDLVAAAGVGLLYTGVAAIYEPASLILLGMAALVIAFRG